MVTTVYYTAHNNWEWIVEIGLNELRDNENLCFVKKGSFKELPSQISCKRKATYSLYRIEIWGENNISRACWMSGQLFGFLDSKDSLYKSLVKVNSSKYMPSTLLLPWDLTDSNISSEAVSIRSALHSEFHNSGPRLLKAALGSGGHGIYFVNNTEQVLQILMKDAEAARNDGNLIDRLIQQHGGAVPEWSLQQYINSVRINQNRTQFRVYAVTMNDSAYIYQSIEVRVPIWDKNIVVLDEYITESDASSREYNDGRDKSQTMRYVITQLPELLPYEETLLQVARDALIALHPEIITHRDTVLKSSLDFSAPYVDGFDNYVELPRIMSVVGIDLLVDQTSGKAYILEFNNNPAMPSPAKLMSEEYRNHLSKFITSILRIGGILEGCNEGFEQLW